MLRHFLQYNVLQLTLICVMVLFTESVMAQSSGDKLYSQGLELQKKQTISSQRSAISKFQSAKKLYDSTTKKKQCDDAIAVSNNIIKSISTPKPHPVPYGDEGNLKVSALEVSNEELQLDYKEGQVTVKITTTEDEWNTTAIANSNDMTFISIDKAEDGKSFNIIFSENTSVTPRSQIIEVRAGTQTKTISVNQSGKPARLSVEKTVVEFGRKGGQKSLDIYSNSDQIERDNNNCNWKVVSKPEWVTVIGEEKKEKVPIVKPLAKAWDTVMGTSAVAIDPSVITSVLKLVVSSKTKDSSSRTGEVVISSADQQVTIVIHQN